MADSDSSVNNDIPGTSGEQAQRENDNEENNKPKRKSRKRAHDDHGQQPCCTKQRCGLKLISSQTKENLNQEYIEQGNTGHGFAYLRRYISPETITNPHGKRRTTYRYYIPNGGKQVEVCQTAFKMVFNITEAAIRSARDERDVVAERRNFPDHLSVQVSSNRCPEYQGVRVKEEPLDDDDVIIINTLPAIKCTCTIGHSVQFTSQDDTTTLEQFKAMTNWSRYKINECTLQKLFEEDCTSLEALQMMEEKDLTSLNVKSGITRGQIILLRSFSRSLNCKRHPPIVNKITDEAEKLMAPAPSTSAISDRSFLLPAVYNDHPRPADSPSTDSGKGCNRISHQNNPGNDISHLLNWVEAPRSHASLQVALPSIAQASDIDSSQTSANNNHEDPQHTGIPDDRIQHSKSSATTALIPESTILHSPSSAFWGTFSQQQNLQNGLGLLSSAASFIPRTANNRCHPYEDAERDDKEPENPQGSPMDAPRNCEAALNNPIGLEKRPIHNGKHQTTQGTMQSRDSTSASLATQYAVNTITSSDVNVNRQQDTNNAVTNHVPTIPMLQKKWKRCGQIKLPKRKAKNPFGIAIHHNGDVAVTSEYNPVAVFSRNGKFKHTIQGSPSYALDIVITANGQYIITGEKELYTYDSQGQLLNTTPTYDINNQPSEPNSVAVDSRGRIIGCLTHKTVSIHQPDGTLISNFQTHYSPCGITGGITCTPDDDLIISFDDILQVMDQSGHNARIIQPPPDMEPWEPVYVCCSKQGELFVSNQGNPRGVYRYVCTNGEYEYIDCVAKTSWNPWGIALSANEEELFVVNCDDSCIQIFR